MYLTVGSDECPWNTLAIEITILSDLQLKCNPVMLLLYSDHTSNI